MTFGAVTRLLRARAAGDANAEAALLPLIYAELRRLAQRQLAGERSGHTLTPTALVHEAWMRLSAEQDPESSDRSQFYALAARRMRQVLIDHARQHKADKRGGGVAPVTLSAADTVLLERDVDVLALEQALQHLEAHDARKAQVVELRYFGGLEMAEIAELLGISRATAQRDWEVARAFLHLQLA
ncbi:ECF-type sigma factor [Dokdonella sp.]|uniref:ECF-type sigma factor n=1 Tax=Dokdonella sp. TaxID=2291710 RepID=UPI0025C0223A|nr:ECF-type sigma factor [Dokdonella sp.]MBX3692809.1 sigma-70 family RNA polymerase sigma factor [Dokdonella sp.]